MIVTRIHDEISDLYFKLLVHGLSLPCDFQCLLKGVKEFLGGLNFVGNLRSAHATKRSHFAPAYLGESDKQRASLVVALWIIHMNFAYNAIGLISNEKLV